VYWGVVYNEHPYKNYTALMDFSYLLNPEKFTTNWGFMEFLMTSCEPPIINS